MLRLMTLSQREEFGRAGEPLPWEMQSAAAGSRPAEQVPTFQTIWRNLLRGGFPELVAEPDRDVPLWQSAYIQTYLERDVQALRQIGDLMSFQCFLRARRRWSAGVSAAPA